MGRSPGGNELKKRGLTISPAGVRCIWLRHDLENINNRLKALEAKSLQEGWLLTGGADGGLRESQGGQRSAWGIRERMYRILRRSGYVLRRNVKGVERIYQKTVIDTYSKVAFPLGLPLAEIYPLGTSIIWPHSILVRRIVHTAHLPRSIKRQSP